MTARHPQAGQEGRPPILTATDDQILDRVGAITITIPGQPPARYVPSNLYLDAVDQWEAWHRLAALVNAWRYAAEADYGGDAMADIDITALDRLLERAGLTRVQADAMNETLAQARAGTLRRGATDD